MRANATTTPEIRAYIKASDKPVGELAKELSVSPATIRRWRGRATADDASCAPERETSDSSDSEHPLPNPQADGVRLVQPAHAVVTADGSLVIKLVLDVRAIDGSSIAAAGTTDTRSGARAVIESLRERLADRPIARVSQQPEHGSAGELLSSRADGGEASRGLPLSLVTDDRCFQPGDISGIPEPGTPEQDASRLEHQALSSLRSSPPSNTSVPVFDPNAGEGGYSRLRSEDPGADARAGYSGFPHRTRAYPGSDQVTARSATADFAAGMSGDREYRSGSTSTHSAPALVQQISAAVPKRRPQAMSSLAGYFSRADGGLASHAVVADYRASEPEPPDTGSLAESSTPAPAQQISAAVPKRRPRSIGSLGRYALALWLVGAAVYVGGTQMFVGALDAFSQKGKTVAASAEEPAAAKPEDKTRTAWSDLSAAGLNAAAGTLAKSAEGTSATGERAFTSAPAVANPAEASGGEWVEISGSGVNMRAGPSSKAEVVTVQSAGIKLRVLSRDGGWAEVIDPETGQKGWVFERYVKPSRPLANIQQTDPSTTGVTQQHTLF